jgi:hypothetical protein
MKPGGSMPHSQGLYNSPYPQFLDLTHISLRSILIFSSHLCLGLPKSLNVKIFKALLPCSTLAARIARLNLLDLIILTILSKWYQL